MPRCATPMIRRARYAFMIRARCRRARCAFCFYAMPPDYDIFSQPRCARCCCAAPRRVMRHVSADVLMRFPFFCYAAPIDATPADSALCVFAPRMPPAPLFAFSRLFSRRLPRLFFRRAIDAGAFLICATFRCRHFRCRCHERDAIAAMLMLCCRDAVLMPAQLPSPPDRFSRAACRWQ